MTFVFTAVTTTTGVSAEAVTAALATANALNAEKGSYFVFIPSAAMPSASVFTFTLAVTNFLGITASASVTVKKLALPAPTLTIQVSARNVRMHHQRKLRFPSELVFVLGG